MGWSVIENFRSGEKFPVVVHTIRAKRQAVAGPFWESKDNELCSLHQIATYQLRNKREFDVKLELINLTRLYKVPFYEVG